MEIVKKKKFKITFIITSNWNDTPSKSDILATAEDIKDEIYDQHLVADVTYEVEELEDNTEVK